MVTALCGSWVIFQLVQGHRYTTDDLSTAAIAIQLYTSTRDNLPRPKSHIDIGCGLGSVLSFVRWFFDDSLQKSVGIEAQLKHVELARKSISVNMKPPSLVSEVRHGDLRDLASNESGLLNAETEFQSFDLVTGTPPYFPVPNGVVPTVQGRGYCSFEMRGGVETYCLAARQCLRRNSDARFVFVQTAIEVKRSEEAIWSLAQMRILERVDFYGVDGKKEPLFVIFVCGWEPARKDHRESDGETLSRDIEKQVKDFAWDGVGREEYSVRRITVRDKDGMYTQEYHDLLVLVGKPPTHFRSSQMRLVVTALLLAASVLAQQPAPLSGCAMFDADKNLHVFGSFVGDLALGASESDWSASIKPTANTTALAGRPPFTSTNLVCLIANYLNAAIFLNADPSDPTSLHIFRFETQTWRKVATTGTGPNMATVQAIIDYDTLVIYAFSEGTMFRLGDAPGPGAPNLNNDPQSLPWTDASNNKLPFDASKYNPTMAHAWFNIYFFGAPGAQAGDVYGFRIHYGEWGSKPQPVEATFPSMHGRTATFTYKNASEFEHNGAPSNVAFIPDDYSGLWVIDSYINMTKVAATPPSAGTSSLTRYVASDRYLVQYTPDTNTLRYLDLAWMFAGAARDLTLNWVDASVLKGLAVNTQTTVAPAATGTAASQTKTSSARAVQTVWETTVVAFACLGMMFLLA
ncbi:hypothetical protein HDU81_004669 [Chytriomyces hyalinus]|nr:hypothetical protein HDU81_004669 [Chytriomyces hyalinus]